MCIRDSFKCEDILQHAISCNENKFKQQTPNIPYKMSYYNPKLMLFPVNEEESSRTELRQVLQSPHFIRNTFAEVGLETEDEITLEKFREICRALGHEGKYKAIQPLLEKVAGGTDQVDIGKLEGYLREIADYDLTKKLPNDTEMKFLFEQIAGDEQSISARDLYSLFMREIGDRGEFDTEVLRKYSERSEDMITPATLKRYLREYLYALNKK
eukprot:TRINITY_DN897_c0_g1_i17.p1 TRINITY_DN897_c0_g1~~TRINITY_DN897_c0_g1_i17.p1  ORF type:complete len:213 (+),score=77.31 TRINITY_DN897_c0_g1_i17:73-711(+)